ncbi:MAG: hypothetical protein LBU77_01985, partial [Clostridiales bacterium]|nr:hypothetical protein [Clostridiales bacterium]
MVMIAGVIDFGGIAADYNEMRETNGGKCVLESQRACLMPSAQGGAHTIRVGEGETTAVCDGRLYNADELRETLSEKGYVFQTDTDAEVFLFSYMAWGEQCAARFLGAFALAVWDSRRGGLFLARDCMGVKPLFYYQHGRMLIFASQIKTVLKHPAVKAEIDETAVAELILLGPGRTPG